MPDLATPDAPRRATRRVPACLPAALRDRDREVSGICLDLSAGGAGLSLRHLPQEGERVSLRIHMPGGHVIEVVAEVMHAGVAGPERCGLRFHELDQSSLFAIHAYVADQKTHH